MEYSPLEYSSIIDGGDEWILEEDEERRCINEGRGNEIMGKGIDS